MKPLLPVLSSVVMLVAGCGGGGGAATVDAPTPVRSAVALDGAGVAAISVHGVVANRDEQRLSFKVGGIVRRIAVEAGDAVRAGQVLAEIDFTEINAQLTQAQQQDERAARDLARGERLHVDEVISLEQLQNLRTQREVAAAQLRAARFNRTYAVIMAPSDGTVLRRMVEENEFVPAGQPALILGSASRGYVVRAAVSDRDLLQLRRGDAVSVSLDAAPGQSLTGKISEVSQAADPATGLFPIEVQLDATPLTLASGMVARLRLAATDRAGKLVRIPTGAIVAADGGKALVFVLAGDRARRREVQVAFLDGTEAALSAGLTAGESVVTAGAPYLEDNERVSVAKD